MFEWLEDQIQEKIIHTRPLGGASMASCHVVQTKHNQYLVKRYQQSNLVSAERRGLASLRASNSFCIPHVVALNATTLVMAFIEPAVPTDHFWCEFAHRLCRLHENTQEEFGLAHLTYCGQTPQPNHPTAQWATFFTTHRLQYMIDLLAHAPLAQLYQEKKNKIIDLLSKVDEKPSLVHGDLWSGNYICSTDQKPYLIDPAIYYGHRETDIAMMKLFGGFPALVYEHYFKKWPLKAGYPQRMKIYQLFHLLNHAHLFGSPYVQQSLAALRAL
jgi:fructosamine-3-kinase